jgi:Immunoglobulin domain
MLNQVHRGLAGRGLIMSLTLLVLVACHDDSSAPPAAVAPTISAQPSDQTVTAGQSVTFTVTASGTAPLSFQWRRDGAEVAGATAGSYSLNSTATSDSGAKFSVIVSNSAGSITSSAAMLTVTAPANLLGTAGGKVSSDDQKLSINIAAGALKGDTTFKITPMSSITGLVSTYVLISGTAYDISWSGAGFAAAASATLSILDPVTGQTQALKFNPRAQPKDASGQVNSVVQCGDSSQIFATTTDPDASDYSDSQIVMCTPNTTDTGVGLVQPAPGEAPGFTAQPASVSYVVGDTAIFFVVASGAPTLKYQWRRNDKDIPNATAATYAFVVAASDNGAEFSVVVSNGYGSVTSSEATLTVGTPVPPPAPQWQPANVISGTTFSVGNDLPQIGQLFDTSVVAWNNNGLLDSNYASNNISVHSFMHPIRSRPMVLSGPNLSVGYLVFVDDDGTSSCNAFSGNRLSAIAIGFTLESGPYTPSNPFTLYQSADCIISFAAGLMPDATDGIVGVTFAVQESQASVIQMGLGGAKPPGSVQAAQSGSWQPVTSAITPLITSSNCSGASISSDSIKAIFQAEYVGDTEPTYATLAFLSTTSASAFVCAAVQSSNGWSQANAVINNAQDSEPVVAVDGAGNSLVVASGIIDPNASTLMYAMTAAYLPAGGSNWQVTPLDSSSGLALPSAAFDDYGNAFIVWRPALPSGPTAVYATRLTTAGSFEPIQTLSSNTVSQSKFPRICVDPTGNAMAIFEENLASDNSFAVVSRLWSHGAWSDIAEVQSDSNDARFADCPRNAGFFVNGIPSLGVTWLETNPNDATENEVVLTTISPAQ